MVERVIRLSDEEIRVVKQNLCFLGLRELSQLIETFMGGQVVKECLFFLLKVHKLFTLGWVCANVVINC